MPRRFRYFDPDPAETAAGVRLVTVDRPGLRRASTALPNGTVATIPTFAGDAAAVLDHLGVDDAVVTADHAPAAGCRRGARRRPPRISSLAFSS